jgi:serine/threonine protein kinase
LGITLYQLLTGERAYDSTTLSEYDIMDKIVKEPLPAPSQRKASIPAWLDAVVEKATLKDPNQRYQSCEEFREALLAGEGHDMDKTVIEGADETVVVDEKKSNKPIKKNPYTKTIVFFFLHIIATIVIYNLISTKEEYGNQYHSLPQLGDIVIGVFLINNLIFYLYVHREYTILVQIHSSIIFFILCLLGIDTHWAFAIVLVLMWCAMLIVLRRLYIWILASIEK